MECDLLQYLVKNAGKAVSRKAILEEVWDLHEDTDTRAIDNSSSGCGATWKRIRPSRSISNGPRGRLQVRRVEVRQWPGSPEESLVHST